MKEQLSDSFEVSQGQSKALGEMESRLPLPLKTRRVARILTCLILFFCLFFIGGAKMRMTYNSTLSIYSATNARGQGIQQDFATWADAAANLIKLGKTVLGSDDENCRYASEMLDAWNKVSKNTSPHDQYLASKALQGAIDLLYTAAINNADGSQKEQINNMHDEFLSCQSIIDRTASSEYNPKAQAYNKMSGSFPANVLGILWRCSSVEEFAPYE